jgi:membrane protein YqaA with SNARE-associated domain
MTALAREPFRNKLAASKSMEPPMPHVALFALFAVALAAPAIASQPDAEPAAAGATAAPKSKMICRTMPTLGSRLGGKRECATAEEWARMQAEHRESLQKQQVLGQKSE